ncbi:CRTAC1 family protein [Colwellia sp. 1_MG-2023]|uniref:CRTAC1 family protein n=1 Tax=unclassified Colwellia TaxID=196834 RepID=UPI001C089B3E|nr:MULTISPECIES: CRTAC1 family protein [unclassified Colwellia]MBU2924277.1 CRTAC1 family protein [Colwellia sp. C2M11]MDO6652986.1 CRTAC1 family protein [Colwellia sp. 3_MG-2023]MDO6665468.1 CRTAC1 family protein [Colwellia sp. 2_MG-2023]MDO6689773.1 CRTAC1 family protein [Colwellia sp. 1_MG-2023]
MSCSSSYAPKTIEPTTVKHFNAASDDIKLENANRRKWDNAVIADLDNDGYQDLLLTDHGFSIKLYWNNQGKFGKGYDFLVGDTHGIAVGDYNKDGVTDILVSRGGGSGDNARNAKLFHIDNQRNITEGKEFDEPLEFMRGRTSKFYDGDNDGELDLLLLGFPGKKNEKNIPSISYKNDGKGQLVVSSRLVKTMRDGQKLLVTDFNGDNISDFILYGDARITMHQGNGDLTFNDVTDEWLSQDLLDVTSISEIDYDNDGDFDLFLTTGKELNIGETFYDEASQTFAFYTKRGPFEFEDLVIGDVFNLENYQSAWPMQDIYLGESGYKYEQHGEYHQGQDIRLINSNALGWPDKLDKKGIYIGYIGNDTWRVAGNTWSPTTGVIHGVKSYPAYKHDQGVANVLLENKNGKFIDVTEKLGLGGLSQSNAAAVGDYDNNGFQDIFIVKRGNLATENQQTLWLNQDGTSFKKSLSHNIISPELGAIGLGAETFDYNQDGKLDIIFANDRGKWHLFKNSWENDNNYLEIEVKNSANGVSPIGATIAIEACYKSQVRRLGSSSALYSQSRDNIIHFGLGDCDTVKSLKVNWPNGESFSTDTIKANQVYKVSF